MDASEFISLDLREREMAKRNVKKYYDTETYQTCLTHLLGIIFKSSAQNVGCVGFRSISWK